MQGLHIVRQKTVATVQAVVSQRRREEEAMVVETFVGWLSEVCNGLQYSMSDTESIEDEELTHVLLKLSREAVAPGQAVPPGRGLSEADETDEQIAVVGGTL